MGKLSKDKRDIFYRRAKELGYRPGSPSSFYMFQEIFDWVRARICLRHPAA